MSQRVKWLDAAKGAAIILVVLGHSLSPSVRDVQPSCRLVYDLIYSFHMPLFAFLSGCGFWLAEKRYSQSETAAFLRKKAAALLLPYATVNLLLFLLFAVCSRIPPLGSLLSSMGHEVLGFGSWLKGFLAAGNPYCYPSWYLYGMFVYSVLGFGILKLSAGKQDMQRLYCCLICGAGLLLHFFSPLGNAMGMRDISYFVVWFFLGWQLRGALPSGKISAALLTAALAAFVLDRAMGVKQMMPDVLFQCVRLLMKTFAVLGFTGCIRLVGSGLEDGLVYLGRHTMEIYLFHQPLLTAGFLMIFYRFMGLNVWVSVFMTAICAVLASLTAGYIIRKIPYLRKLFAI